MKKISVAILLCLMLLFSCSMDQLTGFMGNMGNNVMGSYVDNESITAITDSISNANTTEITDNKIKIGKISIDANGVSNTLSGLSDDEINNYVDNVTSASLNEKSKDELVKAMSEAVSSNDLKTAAKGTASIAEKALNEIISNLGDDNQAIKDSLSTLKDSMSEITAKDSITAGDVVSLQMMTTLVESVADLATVDAGGSVTNIDINSSNVDPILDTALNTVKVISAINGATSVNLGDLSDILKAFTSEDSKALRDSTVIEAKYVTAIQQGYKIYSKVFAGKMDNDTISLLSMYKSSVDVYISLAGKKELSNEVSNLTGIVRYMIASAFVTADAVYEESSGDFIENPPKTLADLLDEIVKANSWINSEESKEADWNLPDSLQFKDSEGVKPIANEIVMDSRMKAMVNTIGSIYDSAIEYEEDNIGLKKYINKLKKVTESGLDAWNE